MINYVYITSGSKAHLKEAELSAKSIKQKQIQSHVTIYTDIEPTNQEYFDKIIPIEPSKTIKEAKTKRIQHLIEHKEEQYVHLDTDTYVNEKPIIENHYSIAATTSQWRQEIFNLVPSVVIINKSQNSQEALKNWLKDYTTSKTDKDQYAFDRQIRKHNYYILSPEYSAQVGEPIQVSGKIIIAHCHYVNQYRNPILPTLVLNQSENNRIWVPPENRMIENIYEPHLNHRLSYKSTYATPEQIQIAEQFMHN